MPLIDVTFPLSSDPAEFAFAGQARVINCYAEMLGDRAASSWAMQAISGLTQLSELTGEGGFRAMVALSESEAIAVVGRQAVRIDTTGTMTVLGGMPSDGHVSIAVNSDGEVAAVCDGLVFGYTGGTWSQISDEHLPPPIAVTSIGGYFIFLLADGRMYASELNDYDVQGLSYVDTETSPDRGVVVWTRGDDLLAGGKASIEVWQITGAENFPGVKVSMVIAPDRQQTIGVLAPGSALDGFFIASDKTLRMLNGYSASIISPAGLNRAIAADPSPEAIEATTWSERGHTFYAWSGTDWTWVYDATTQKWHERESYGLDRWRVAKCATLGSVILAGNYDDGLLYSMSHDVATEAGAAIVMSLSSAPVLEPPYRLRHDALHVRMVPGTAATDATDHHVMLDWSDNGQPWGTQLTRSLGGAAQVNHQIRVNGLGSSFSRTYRVSASSALKRMILGAQVSATRMGAV